MGKTHKKVNSLSQSSDYHSDHSRKILGTKKKTSRRQLRCSNKLCDEDNILLNRDIKNRIKDHWASGYYQELGNVPYIFGDKMERDLKCNEIELNREILCSQFCIKMTKWNNHGTREEVINKIIDSNIGCQPYWIATKKQIERRGVAKRFYGHRQQNY